MPFVHSIAATPPPRYDAVPTPWDRVRIEESADNIAFAAIDTQALAPLDADPQHPALRHLTTALASIAAGYFRVVWLDAADNESAPSLSVYSPSPGDDSYPSLDELLGLASDAALLGTARDAQIVLRASAINAVERWAGQAFVQEGTPSAPVTKELPGTGTDTIWLPARLQQLVALEIVGSWLTAADVKVSAEGDQLVVSPPDVATGTWLDRAMVDLEAGQGPPVFVAGPGRVRISGVWGWTDAEWATDPRLAAVRRAILFDMEDNASADANELAETVRVARELGVRSLSQGNLSIQMASSGEPLVSERVRRELAGLRWTGPVVATA